MSDIKFVDGVYFSKPSERAPDFVVGNISFVPEKIIAWLNDQTPNEKGYVNCQIKIARSGKPYVALDDYQPRERREEPQGQRQAPPPQPPYDDGAGDEFGDDSKIPF